MTVEVFVVVKIGVVQMKVGRSPCAGGRWSTLAAWTANHPRGGVMGTDQGSRLRVDRRKFLTGASGALATAGMANAIAGTASAAPSTEANEVRFLPAPKPIPGGLDFGQLIHLFLPGPNGVVLPFTGSPLGGFDVEPSTITDFRGQVALAYLLGSAETSDGKQDLEVDIRVMQGRYVAENGERRFGTFAEI
jgi:hypothetical protein